MKSAATITRRSVLGAGLLAIAACKHDPSHPAPRVDPDAAALSAAIASEHALIAVSEAAGLAADLAQHRTHLAALGGRTISPSATSSPVGLGPIDSLLRSNADMLRAAAVAAADGKHAALLASIAASHDLMTHE